MVINLDQFYRLTGKGGYIILFENKRKQTDA